jgi:hypothetical protein
MTNRTDIVVLGYLVSLGDWRSNTTSSSTTYPLRVLSSSSNLIKFDDQDYNLRFFIVAITIKIMNSDKQSNSNTTGSANLAKARPAWKRTGTGRRKVTWQDQQDITKPQFKLKKVWTVRKDRMNNIRRSAICVNKGNLSLAMNNSFLTQ